MSLSEFEVLQKLGTFNIAPLSTFPHEPYCFKAKSNTDCFIFVGDGSYSSVYKVRRFEDNCLYALKKVKI